MRKKKRRTKSASEQEVYAEKLKKTGAVSFLNPNESAANAIGGIARDVKLNGEGVTGIDVYTLADELKTQNEAMHQGDMSRLEAMLLDQSHVLQTLFTYFTHKLSHAEYLGQLETFSRIALKAQNQCRQTLATLGELKNPKRATFVKQQNNAVNQQINQDGKRGKNLKKSNDSANELLEVLPDERLDTRTPQAASQADQDLEAVEKGHRAKDIRRQK